MQSFAFFCSQQQSKRDSDFFFSSLFSFHFFIFSFSLRLSFCCFSFWSLVSHTHDGDYCLFLYRLALTRAYGKFVALSSFFFICALGSVHDGSCIGVTLPLRFSPLCVFFLIISFSCVFASAIRLSRLQTVMNKRTRRIDNDLSMLSFVVLGMD